MSDNRPNVEEIIKSATFGTIMTALMIAALTGNILCFKLTRRLLWNKPSLALVLNLNMSDIIVACVSWVGFVFQHIAIYSGLDIHVIIHKVFWSILITLANVTLLTLVGLACDCFIALRWPLHYKSIATYKSVNIYIAVIWILSIVAGSSDFMVAAGKHQPEKTFYGDIIRDSMVFTGTDRRGLEVLIASLTMLISNTLSFICLMLMVGMYAYILLKIRRVRIDNTLSKQGGFKSEIAAVRTTAMIFTSFLLLWLPTLIMNILSMTEPNYLSGLSYLQASIIGYTADSLLMVHSIVDAFIYGVRIKKTLTRHRKSRESQAGFSRANTIKRRNSDYDTTPPEYQEVTNETTTSDYMQRRHSTTSSLQTGTSRNIETIATISETITNQTENSNSLSDDSGISSPQKLSPQYQVKLYNNAGESTLANHSETISDKCTSLTLSDCYSTNTTADLCRSARHYMSILVTENSDASLSEEECSFSERTSANEKAMKTNTTLHFNQSVTQSVQANISTRASSPSTEDNPKATQQAKPSQTLIVPKETKPLRSSLKMSKSDNKSNNVLVESHVRFCFSDEPITDKIHDYKEQHSLDSRRACKQTSDQKYFTSDASKSILTVTVDKSPPTPEGVQAQGKFEKKPGGRITNIR
ncbi:serine-rich adhesin for platelets-like [Watersipora subatra]|uniref:serine-rich adhesin for platelets-like n=1 Tax=Watersipora subatra TaxID=2589382 RepID=UPI00355BBECE